MELFEYWYDSDSKMYNWSECCNSLFHLMDWYRITKEGPYIIPDFDSRRWMLCSEARDGFFGRKTVKRYIDFCPCCGNKLPSLELCLRKLI